ncbi:MAG: hypothetical protein A3E98_04590 [Candidatus Doudnabacteria bacterium RIFCSPHIGHO2_12_FULL_48_11]|uniref:Uncharacterized protein n=1 Tax=Candidatus Doudnabacteria bacterium RIFCSPHIGHO2_01_FULL_46_24 TaxID=1817825 RepID=A0A1F5NSR9_9BACT|nr:MAG: hypothetical protein A2720_04100 [Candidatus Doudnabacteria bacterium RIFCSPHIGHO2_01_FULL_46_24]OGE95355.1 MAG: hypothetical protein A3E98_04590 [Candidatus Doudnabacteria bacterium RIFCSPHIGHO2_12_FULL_48_11]
MALETGYGREELKSRLQALEQEIARIEAGNNPDKKDLDALHAEYEQLQTQLNQNDLREAA